MFQADMPLLAIHVAHADSTHLTNDGNSGPAEIGVINIEAMMKESDSVYGLVDVLRWCGKHFWHGQMDTHGT
jgi:hypothetical protein